MKDFSYITQSHPAFIENLYRDFVSFSKALISRSAMGQRQQGLKIVPLLMLLLRHRVVQRLRLLLLMPPPRE
jgi:hypothetical protein